MDMNSFEWRPTNLVHCWSSKGASLQLWAEWTINTLIHVIHKLCILTVLTCGKTVSNYIINKYQFIPISEPLHPL